MNALEDFLRPTQAGLFKLLWKRFAKEAVAQKGSFLLVPGESPVLLIAHLDTVHRSSVNTICLSKCGNILMSPQGIGGDDRCGVYGIVKVYEAAEQKPWLLFTCDEETGGRGARVFCDAYHAGWLPEGVDTLKMLIELDRKGKNDAVYYDCENPKFEDYITGKGFRTDYGSFSDISIIAPALGVAAVNLSCGYYNAHTLHESINRKQLKATVKKVVEIVADAAKPDFPRYEYIEAVRHFNGYGGYFDYFGDNWNRTRTEPTKVEIPKDLPEEYKGIYEELLELYEPMELDYYWKKYGVQSLLELYEYEYGVG